MTKFLSTGFFIFFIFFLKITGKYYLISGLAIDAQTD